MKLLNPPPRPTRRHRSARGNLPEQYEMLSKLFNGLDSALRLLRMRKSVPFFTRIRPIVESITGRRFAHGHLAQMKYLMPDQVLIKRVPLVDEETGCMKHDLHVTLIRSAIKSSKERMRGADHRHCVKKLFRSQLLDFLKGHPDGTDIPEEVLLAPFNEQMIDPEANSSVYNEVLLSHVHQERPQVAACHLSQSLRGISQGRAQTIRQGSSLVMNRRLMFDCLQSKLKILLLKTLLKLHPPSLFLLPLQRCLDLLQLKLLGLKGRQ